MILAGITSVYQQGGAKRKHQWDEHATNKFRIDPTGPTSVSMKPMPDYKPSGYNIKRGVERPINFDDLFKNKNDNQQLAQVFPQYVSNPGMGSMNITTLPTSGSMPSIPPVDTRPIKQDSEDVFFDAEEYDFADDIVKKEPQSVLTRLGRFLGKTFTEPDSSDVSRDTESYIPSTNSSMSIDSESLKSPSMPDVISETNNTIVEADTNFKMPKVNMDVVRKTLSPIPDVVASKNQTSTESDNAYSSPTTEDFDPTYIERNYSPTETEKLIYLYNRKVAARMYEQDANNVENRVEANRVERTKVKNLMDRKKVVKKLKMVEGITIKEKDYKKTSSSENNPPPSLTIDKKRKKKSATLPKEDMDFLNAPSTTFSDSSGSEYGKKKGKGKKGKGKKK